MQKGLRVVAGALLAAGLVFAQKSAEADIRKTDAEWLKAVQAKDAAKSASFYGTNASMMNPNEPIVTGRDAIEKAWEKMFQTPDFSLTWQTTKIEVARSGDIAYQTGTFDLTAGDAKEHGKFLTVWKKEGGAWKVEADMSNSDTPPAGH